MPKVVFTDRFDFRPAPSIWQTFLPAQEPQMVTTPCAAAAIAAGKAAPPAGSQDPETPPELPAEPQGPLP